MSAPLPPEQEHYARWLDLGTRAGLAALVIGFAAYVLELFEAHIPLQELQRMWGLPLAHYLQISGAPSGWNWISLLHKADYFNFIGIAILGLVTMACYARLIVALLKAGDRQQLVLAIVQVLVLLASASGLLAGGD